MIPFVFYIYSNSIKPFYLQELLFVLQMYLRMFKDIFVSQKAICYCKVYIQLH